MDKIEIKNNIEKIKTDFVIPRIKEDSKELIALIKNTYDHSLRRTDSEVYYRKALEDLIKLENSFQKDTYHNYGNNFIEYQILNTVIGKNDISPEDLNITAIDSSMLGKMHLNMKIENDALKQKIKYLTASTLLSLPFIALNQTITNIAIFVILVAVFWFFIIKDKQGILRNKYDKSYKKLHR